LRTLPLTKTAPYKPDAGDKAHVVEKNFSPVK
jgi:hypothetical protein